MSGHDGGNKEDRPQVRDDLIFRQLDEEWVVYDSVGEKLHVFNATAALVWIHCTGDFTVSEIVREVEAAYEGKAERELIENDVQKTIRDFDALGFLI